MKNERNLLVVDDDPINRLVVRVLMERRNFRVIEAAGCQEAIEAIGKMPFDLVLMDLSMPDIDGFETTRRIRQLEGNDKLPILALTAHSSKKDQAKCEAAGMNAVLRKPFNSEQVDRMLALIDLEHKGPKS